MKKLFLVLLAVIVSIECSGFNVKVESVRNLTLHSNYSLYSSDDFPLRAHVIKLSLNDVDLKLIPALGQREETSSIAQRSGAFIAINGSNYRRGGKYNGNRVNLMYVDNQIFSDLNFIRGSFGWNSTTRSIIFDTMFLRKDFSINTKVLSIDAINQPRASGQSVLYNHIADPSLFNHTPGKNIVINSLGSVETISYELPHHIPCGWLIYQVDKDTLPDIQQGDVVKFNFEIASAQSSFEYNDCDFIVAGAGLLIRDGNIVTDQLYDEFSQGNAIVHCSDEVAADFHEFDMQKWLIDQRHPRTALGFTDTNEICIVVVDGRQKESEGLTLPELALLMKQLGCVNALNIGGGGCSTLWIENKVVNSPSAQQERPVSEALCFFLRNL